MSVYLNEGIEALQDLFLDHTGGFGLIWQQLYASLVDKRQQQLHGMV